MQIEVELPVTTALAKTAEVTEKIRTHLLQHSEITNIHWVLGKSSSRIYYTCHVLTTTMTTFLGFLPLILGGGAFWPLWAVAIAGGVMGATLLALYFVPAAYLLLVRGDRQASAMAPATAPAGSPLVSCLRTARWKWVPLLLGLWQGE